MSSQAFSETEIRNYAFPAIIEAGKRCYAQGRVKQLQQISNDIIAQVHDEPVRRVVLTRHVGKPLQFACSCGFSLGCACEHAVAAMLATNEQQAIQTGMDFSIAATPVDPPPDNLLPSSQQSEMFPSPEIETVRGKPVGRLYLSEEDGQLIVELRFAYPGPIEFTRTDPPYRLVPAGYGRVTWIERSRARESALIAQIMDRQLRSYLSGSFTPNTDAKEWVSTSLPLLAKEGFEIYGQENLTASRTRSSAPRLSVSVSVQGDMLRCDVSLNFDGIPATLASLIAAVRDRTRFVLLTDGSTGTLPEHWIEKLSEIFALSDMSGDGSCIHFQRTQRAAADLLMEMADENLASQALAPLKETLSDFTKIQHKSPPHGLAATLRPYQQAGYEWFYFLRQSCFGGCLADDMGLGKTLQTIALLLNEKDASRQNRTSLVIAPTSLLFNWEREIRKFAPSMVVLTYHGSDRKRHKPESFILADVMLTSYGTALRDLATLKRIRFNYLILDEAQTIKSPLSRISRAVRELSSDHRLALSGTPVENNLSELWSLFTFLNPGMLGSYPQFAKNFARPIEKDGNAVAAEVLKRMIFPFVLRRTKKQVAPELPPKIETKLFGDMLPRQRMVYDATRELFRGKIMQSIDREGLEGSRMQLLEGLLRLRQICCHPCLMDPLFTGDSGKFTLLDACVEDAVSGGHKILVFSQFVQGLELVRLRLAKQGIKSELLTGQTADRAAVVDRFQSSETIPVFLISLKAGGTGLNLTSADYVVHLDPWWNPAAEDQASDRAYRIGQKRTVFVYKMIMKDSIEERVLSLQESKRKLIEQIISTEKTFFKELTRNDIEELFS